MVGMKKTALILIALALLACLVVIGSRKDEPVVGASVSETPRGPSFEVYVVRPRPARPLFGILPRELEAKLLGGVDLEFDNASRGAEVGSVGRDRLELSADGWELLIETNSEGEIAPGTHLVFPVELANKQRTLRCRPADRPSGYLHTSTRAGSDELDGSFLVELATCSIAETGKTIEWPPAPLTVHGNFVGLTDGLRCLVRRFRRFSDESSESSELAPMVNVAPEIRNSPDNRS